MKNPFRTVTNFRASITFENALEKTLKGKTTRYAYLSVQRVHQMLKFARLNRELVGSSNCDRKLYNKTQSALNGIVSNMIPKKVCDPYYSVRNCQAFTDKHVVAPATFEQMCAAYDMDPKEALSLADKLRKKINEQS